jgi:hypothetical protein
MELATKVDAAIEDGDSLCCRFCPDSLLDHIAAKVFAPEMDEELLMMDYFSGHSYLPMENQTF